MKLLVIDDNLALVRSLKDFLGKDFVIDTERTAKEGLRQAITNSSDVIVLDLGLPDGSGSDVCQQIRAANVTTPILILSGVSSVQSRVDLLGEFGAELALAIDFRIYEFLAL